MKILFLHPNMPGQYKHLAPAFAKDSQNQVVFITKKRDIELPNITKVTYALKRDANPKTHRYLIQAERAVLQGQEVWRCLRHLKDEKGFTPDIIVAHPGWGDALYVKDLFPDVPLFSFFEFYYHGAGADVGFDPEEPARDDDLARVRTKNAPHLLNLVSADWGISPTLWQHGLHPKEFHSKITPIHDGINTEACRPDADAVFKVNDDLSFKLGDEVVTYIARNFEPYRGFPTFMQAAEKILKERPNCHIIAVGADGVSYGKRPQGEQTYRQHWLSKLDIDRSRLHFVGHIPYAELVKMMQVSAAHIYLTYPFVLSWSAMEAMACGCAMVASDTQPVREVIQHGHNGLLVDFFSPDALAEAVYEILESPDKSAKMRAQARADMVQKYDLYTLLPLHMQLIRDVAEGNTPPPTHDKVMALYDSA
jgi:glycosyltransferase involved in cell wall biosynthesis